jgi:hypothetical protein
MAGQITSIMLSKSSQTIRKSYGGKRTSNGPQQNDVLQDLYQNVQE